MANESPRRLLRVEEVAALTSLSLSYLNKLRVAGNGPPFRKIGRAVLYDPQEVGAWVDRHKQQSTSENGGAK